jgi:hypothetical protein
MSLASKVQPGNELGRDSARGSPIMSPAAAEPASVRNVRSPFTKIIAARYYDGPMEGFLEHRDWPEACVFQLLDWDRETDLRVYEIARLPDLTFDDVVAMLFEDRRPTWPIWVLPSSVRSRGEQLVDASFSRSQPVATVTTRDLTEQIARWDAAEGAPASSGLVPANKRHDDPG